MAIVSRPSGRFRCSPSRSARARRAVSTCGGMPTSTRDDAHRRASDPGWQITPGEALGFGLFLSVASVMVLGLAANWLSAALLAFTHRVLCRDLLDVAEAVGDRAEHRHRRCRGRPAAGDWSGRGDGPCGDRVPRPLRDHLHLDAAALLGARAIKAGEYARAGYPDDAERRRAGLPPAARSCGIRSSSSPSVSRR